MRKGQGRKTILDARDIRALRRHCITYRNATVMEITTWAQEYFQKTSNQIKSLLLSHHHSTSALMSEILMSVLQTVQKNNRQFTYGQTVQKKTTDNLHMDRQCKKLHWSIYSAPDSAKKTTTAIYIWTDSAKKQQQFTYGQYIFTDCTEDNVQNTHTYTQYT